MIFRLTVLLYALLSISPVRAEPAKWDAQVQVDDFDDSKTFVSVITATDQGALGVRYHEDTTSRLSMTVTKLSKSTLKILEPTATCAISYSGS